MATSLYGDRKLQHARCGSFERAANREPAALMGWLLHRPLLLPALAAELMICSRTNG
jgi:hypothetical protein